MLRVTSRNRPQVIDGQYRLLLLWSDIWDIEVETAAATCADVANLERGLAQLFRVLSLRYSLVVIEHGSRLITLASGHINKYPIYFRACNQGFEISDVLPVKSVDDLMQRIDQSGFADFIARSIVTGPYELSIDTITMDRYWSVVPSGQTLMFKPDGNLFRIESLDNVYFGIRDELISSDCANAELRDAIDEHLIKLANIGLIASEFSGGIDSSIVRARCLARVASRYLGGVTCRFPYAEFAREIQMQEAVLQLAPGLVTFIDHREFLPFSALSEMPFHVEPTLASTSWGTFRSSASAAYHAGGRTLVSGHGGDTLFRWHPEEKLNYSLPVDLSRWLRPSLYSEVSARAEAISAGINEASGEGFGGLWHPGMFDPRHPNTLVQSSMPRMQYVSGLISRRVLRAAARLWFAGYREEKMVQKPFAYSVFGGDLPLVLWMRPGKVDHLGIVYRGAVYAREDILDAFNSCASMLESLGVQRRNLLAAANAATLGFDAGNPMMSILLALSKWISQFNHRPGCQLGGEQDGAFIFNATIMEGGESKGFGNLS